MGRVFHVGRWIVEPDLNTLSTEGKSVRVEPKVMEVCVSLAERGGEVVSKEQLMRAVWADTFVTDDVLIRCVSELRKVLEDDPKNPRLLQTIPKRGYRLAINVVGPARPETSRRPLAKRLRSWAALALLLLSVAAIVAIFSVLDRRPVLSAKDSVLIAEFANSTGDPVFDDTLKQGLAVDLEQSPFINILSDQSVLETLRLMGRAPGERLTPALAAEVCQRAGSAVVLEGSIARLGTQYVLGLKAVNCGTREFLAQEQVTADSKERVMKSLHQAASKLRRRLGESPGTVQKFDAPLEQATTPSLEALKAYSLGVKAHDERAEAEAAPFFKRAIELDPHFAMAYSALGGSYANLGEYGLLRKYWTRAAELSDGVSQREKFIILSLNSGWDWERGIQVDQLWKQTYPRDSRPYSLSGAFYAALGNYEKALPELKEGLRLSPSDSYIPYAILMRVDTALGHFDEAKAAFQQAQAHHLEQGPHLHFNLYAIAFLENDAGEMERQETWAAGKPGVEDVLLAARADKEALCGHLQSAREFSRRAMDSAHHNDLKGTAAIWRAVAALREAELGNRTQSRREAKEALSAGPNRDLQAMAALALARTGDVEAARSVNRELEKQWSSTQAFMIYYGSSIHAAIELDRGNAARAIELLKDSTHYELGELYPASLLQGFLYPAWLRGLAYLRLRQGTAAAVEFQKFLDHRGIVRLCPLGALAHLGLARAYVLQGDTAKARAAYQDFLALWKDADPDIPILKQAKAEYAKLQ